MSVSDTELNRRELEADDRLQQSHVLRRLLQRPEVGAIIGAGALWLYFAVVAGDSGFLSARGTASYLEVSAQLGILAIAVSLLMIGGEFDLSIGSMIGAAGMILAIFSMEYELNLWLAMAIALAAWSSAIVLMIQGGRSFGWAIDADAQRRLPIIVLAAAAMGVLLWLLTRTMPSADHKLAQAALVALQYHNRRNEMGL